MTVIQHRRGTTAEWAASSYILEAGEIGVEIDTSTTPDTVIGAKIGNGESLWGALSYVGNIAADLTDINSITFNTTPSPEPTATGSTWWNAAEETLNVKLNEDVTLQLGQEQIIRAKNMTGSTIPNGTVVMFSGVNGDQIQIAPAIANGSVDHHYMMGITTEPILTGESGFVTTQGLVRGLNTSAWAAGTILYIDPSVAGGLTSTEPVAPNLKLPVAAVTKSGPGESGILLVRMTTGEHLESLHDVQVSSPADNEVLAYNSANGTWINQTPSEAGLAALAGATFSGTVVMNNVGVDINDTDSRVGRIIGSGNIMYIQGGADSADTTGRIVIGRTASSSNISQLDLRADTTNILGKLEVSQKKNALIVSAYNSATADPDKFANNSRVIMTAAATGSSNPTTRPDGTALVAGDVWIGW